MTGPNVFVLDNICVKRGGAEVVGNISARLHGGAITAICGPNGAGKSTLMAALANALPSTGMMTWKGSPPDTNDLSFMPQALGLRVQLSVLEVVLLGRLERLRWSLLAADIDAAGEAMQSVGIIDLAHRRVDTLSGGQQQLVLIAQRLIRKPEVLLLDEPTSALDLRRQLLVLDILKTYAEQSGALVAIVMHDLSLAARYAQHLLLMHDGALACSGKPAAILTSDMIRLVYGVEAEILSTRNGTPVIAPLSPSVSEGSGR